jgi:hypothetical protein
LGEGFRILRSDGVSAGKGVIGQIK